MSRCNEFREEYERALSKSPFYPLGTDARNVDGEPDHPKRMSAKEADEREDEDVKEQPETAHA